MEFKVIICIWLFALLSVLCVEASISKIGTPAGAGHHGNNHGNGITAMDKKAIKNEKFYRNHPIQEAVVNFINSKNVTEQFDVVKHKLVNFFEKNGDMFAARDGFGLGGWGGEGLIFPLIILIIFVLFTSTLWGGGGYGGYGGHHGIGHHGHHGYGRKRRELSPVTQELLSTLTSRVISAIERPFLASETNENLPR